MREREQITIADLRGNNVSDGGIKQVNISEMPTVEEHKLSPKEEFNNEILGMLDQKVQAVAKESIEYRKKLQEEEFEDELDEKERADKVQLVENYVEEETTTAIPQEEKKVVVKETPKTSNMTIDEKDFEDDDDEEEKLEDENVQEEIRGILKDKLNTSMNKIDLKSFTIKKSPIPITTALSYADNKFVADWVLTASETAISMSEFKGAELDNLIERTQAAGNRAAQQDRIFKLIYDHITNPDKPIYDTWKKTFNFYDLEDLYFAIYMASYQNANYMPYQCPECKNTFVSENIPIDKLVKYENKEAEAKVKKILAENITQGKEFEVELVQISNDYVVGLKEPSLYDIVFQNSLLDEAFVAKYTDVLSTVAFIDSIYVINRQDNSIAPIELVKYEKNEAKTIKSKIKRFASIINTLSSDEYQLLNECISAIGKKYTDISYVIPEAECPKCKHHIQTEEIDSRSLLFIRHQLTVPSLT